tara:strand:+ start:3258 stop:3503 length:246 start_codon:yes stop_codon:yes gene_type:complete
MFDFYSRQLGGQQEQKSNELRAVSFVNACVGELLGKLYVEKYFKDEHKKKMESIVLKVQSSTERMYDSDSSVMRRVFDTGY